MCVAVCVPVGPGDDTAKCLATSQPAVLPSVLTRNYPPPLFFSIPLQVLLALVHFGTVVCGLPNVLSIHHALWLSLVIVPILALSLLSTPRDPAGVFGGRLAYARVFL